MLDKYQQKIGMLDRFCIILMVFVIRSDSVFPTQLFLDMVQLTFPPISIILTPFSSISNKYFDISDFVDFMDFL